MKKHLIGGVVCCAIVAGLALASDKPKSPAPTTRPTSQPAEAVNKFCAVDKENPVDSTVPTVTYKGKVIGFCCDDCPPKFKKNPELYMKDLK